MFFKDKNNKYLWIYLGITFGLSWGLSILYIAFFDVLAPLVGPLDMGNPIVIFTLNSPSIAGIIVYLVYGGWGALFSFLKHMIPREKDCWWFWVIGIQSIIFVICLHYGSILFGINMPVVTMSTADRVIVLLKNIYEETGLLGGAFGWFGFLLPYLQEKTHSSIKSGLLTGLIFGLFVLPGYAFSSFETATAYPFYVIQLMLFFVFLAFIFNETNGNVIFFIFAFWLAASGSKLQFYEFNKSVQILEMFFYAISAIGLYMYYKMVRKVNLDSHNLVTFPDFIENE